MQVDLDEVIDNKSRKFSNDIRSQLRKNKIRYSSFKFENNKIFIDLSNNVNFEEVEDMLNKIYQRSMKFDKFDLKTIELL